MDEAHKELVKRLTATRTQRYLNWNDVTYPINPDGEEAARALEALAGEVVAARKHGKLLNKMLGEAEAERDRLKAALGGLVEQVAASETWVKHTDAYEIALIELRAAGDGR